MQIANFAPQPAIVALPITVADCANTASETAIMTVVVPANTWANGQTISMTGYLESKNNSGGIITVALKAKVGSTAIQLVSTTAGNSATMGRGFRGLSFQRQGTDILLFPAPANATAFQPTTATIAGINFSTDNFSTNKYTGNDFTADITLTLTCTWASAGDATTFCNCKSATAHKY